MSHHSSSTSTPTSSTSTPASSYPPSDGADAPLPPGSISSQSSGGALAEIAGYWDPVIQLAHPPAGLFLVGQHHHQHAHPPAGLFLVGQHHHQHAHPPSPSPSPVSSQSTGSVFAEMVSMMGGGVPPPPPPPPPSPTPSSSSSRFGSGHATPASTTIIADLMTSVSSSGTIPWLMGGSSSLPPSAASSRQSTPRPAPKKS